MTTVQALPRGVLYEHDETAWLETMAELIRLGRLDEIDYPNLAEYLADMARRDRREVESRLTVLIVHALKWAHQPDRRSGSWKATIIEQRQELEGLVSRDDSETTPRRCWPTRTTRPLNGLRRRPACQPRPSPLTARIP